MFLHGDLKGNLYGVASRLDLTEERNFEFGETDKMSWLELLASLTVSTENVFFRSQAFIFSQFFFTWLSFLRM